ncbi:hypothetical protein [Salegentibacter sp. F14]
MQRFIFIICLLFSSILYGQNNTELKGIIRTDSIINPVNVVNLTQKTGISVLPFQNFILKVRKNDTLSFSALNLQNKIIIVDTEILRKKTIEIFLKEKLNELEEVRIHKLSGNLEKDIERIETFDKFKLNAPMSRKKPPTQTERKIYTATTGPGGTKLNLFTILSGRIPIDPLLNTINGRTKKLKNLKKIDENVKLLNELKIKFPKTFFVEICKIEESDIYLFLMNCIENPEFPNKVESLNQVELIDSLKENSVYFNEVYKQ